MIMHSATRSICKRCLISLFIALVLHRKKCSLFNSDFELPIHLCTVISELCWHKIQERHEWVTAQASCSMDLAEQNAQNYSSLKQELRALKCGDTEKFKYYQQAATFKVFTNAQLLMHLQNTKLALV